MKVRFITDFAENWKAGDVVEVVFLPNKNTLVDNVALINTTLLMEHCEVITESEVEEWLENATNDSIEHAIDSNLEFIPSVTPARKKGKWIFTKTIFDKYGCTVECPSCHKKWKTYDEIRWKKENKFCPNCGADKEDK